MERRIRDADAFSTTPPRSRRRTFARGGGPDIGGQLAAGDGCAGDVEYMDAPARCVGSIRCTGGSDSGRSTTHKRRRMVGLDPAGEGPRRADRATRGAGRRAARGTEGQLGEQRGSSGNRGAARGTEVQLGEQRCSSGNRGAARGTEVQLGEGRTEVHVARDAGQRAKGAGRRGGGARCVLTRRGHPAMGGLFTEEVRRCPTLPQGPPCSTIGAERLSFRVRNVTGRFPLAMAAETLWMFQKPTTKLFICCCVPDRTSRTTQWTRAPRKGDVIKSSAY